MKINDFFLLIKENKATTLLILLIIGIKIWAYFDDKSMEDGIKERLGITYGYILDFSHGGYKANPYTSYDYFVKSEKYYGSLSGSGLGSLYHKYVFVVFDTSNPLNEQLLFEESCFKKFGLPIPDSIVMNVPPKENPFSNQ